MRLKIVAAAIVIALFAASTAVQGFSLPWKASYLSADGMPVPSFGIGNGGTDPFQGLSRVYPAYQGTGRIGPLKGLSSVDFLGEIRRQVDIGRLVSSFPGTWLGGASAAAGGTIEYLGQAYTSTDASPPSGELYNTGESYDGKPIYAPAGGKSPHGLPDLVFVKDGDSYRAYAVSGRPSVYAYVLYGAYNEGEAVGFGLANDGAGVLNLSDSAPFVVQRNDGGEWRTVFTPVAAQVITPVLAGSYREWQWDQVQDDGSTASYGSYRALIAGKYAAPFRLAADVPAVSRSGVDYDLSAVLALANSSPVPGAFARAYPSPSAGEREAIISTMQYKAWALGLDPGRLRAAIESTGTDGLPCLAVHASYSGQPSWIILFSPGASGAIDSTAGVYVVDDVTGRPVYRPSTG